MGLFDKFKKKKAGASKQSVEAVENPQLLARWENYLADTTDEHLNQFYEEVCTRAVFLLLAAPLDTKLANGTNVLKEKTSIVFPLLENANNEHYYPAFTDWKAVSHWKQAPSNNAFVFSFDDLASMIIGNPTITGLSINPFNENIVLSKQLIQHLKMRKDILETGHSEIKVTEDTAVQLGQPEPYPTELVRQLDNFFNKQTTVNRAWIQLMKKEAETSYLLIVDFEGDKNKLFPVIAEITTPYLNGLYIDMIPYTSEEGFVKNATLNLAPFYSRNN
ncbi:enhanced serine sensitivity protein SseB [Enterococcus sp. LJL51]|uniref:enhanced serine sensitivity protein SseB n=1 Tax=Enterococcus sp. LJL51 TaxID=3416656 RepID=UPI003CEC4ABD